MFTFEEGVGQITSTVNQSTEADPDLAFTLSAATDSFKNFIRLITTICRV